MRSYEKARRKVSFTEQSLMINYDPENLPYVVVRRKQ